MNVAGSVCIMVASTVATLALFAPSAAAQEPATVTSIDVTHEGEFFTVRASAAVAVPRSLAWAVLTDYEHYPDFVPELEVSRVVYRQGNGVVLEQKGRMSFLFFSQPLDVRLVVFETPQTEVVSRAVAGNLRDFTGRYLLQEIPGGVRVLYSARLLPAFDLPPLLGPIVVRSVIERNFAATLQEMRRRQAPDRPAANVEPRGWEAPAD